MGYVTNYRTAYRDAYRTAYQTATQDTGFDLIPVIRPNFSYFSFSGLRPNTAHWIFFDNTDVTRWVNTSFDSTEWNDLERNSPIRNPGDIYLNETAFPAALGGPTAASGPVYTNSNGEIDGLFYIQSNDSTNFPVGNRILTCMDISVLNRDNSLSVADAEYSAIGEYELYYEYQQSYQQSYQQQYQQSYQVAVPPPPPVFVPAPPPPPSGYSGYTPRPPTIDVIITPPPPDYVKVKTKENDKHSHDDFLREKASTQPLRPRARGEASNESNSNSGSAESTVICTALHNMKMLSDDIYKLDVEFGKKVNQYDPNVSRGYRHWATPIADYIQGRSVGSKVALAIVAPLAKSWAQEMAHCMRPREYNTNIVGKVMMAVGYPICRIMGKMIKSKAKELNT